MENNKIHPYVFAGLNDQEKILTNYYLNNDLIKLFAKRLNLKKKDVISKCRKRPLVYARMLISKKLQNRLSLKKVGALLGGLDHSSIIYLNTTFDELIETKNKEFAAYFRKVEDLF
jgi:chromosomal replication initiation ATPase DnaA